MIPRVLIEGILSSAITCTCVKRDGLERLRYLTSLHGSRSREAQVCHRHWHIHVTGIRCLQRTRQQIPLVGYQFLLHPCLLVGQTLLVNQLGLGLEIDFLADIAIELLTVIDICRTLTVNSLVAL